MYCTEQTLEKWHLKLGVVVAAMRQKSLREAKEALAKALQGLEQIRMTLPDDPKLSALKNDIRRTVEQPELENEENAAAA